METEVKFWPRVRWTMRESFYNSEWRLAPTFPFPETEYTKLCPTPSGGLSKVPQLEEQNVLYHAQTGEATFEKFFTESYEFAGHAKLRLWVEARGADNMDLFVVVKKLDADGNVVHFPWITIIKNGPVAFGYLRVSRRELDKTRSTDIQPYHSHQRDLFLEPGQIVPVDIEILPTSCRFRAGETLQINISGHDYGKFPSMIPVPRHGKTVNKGTHLIHFGGQYDSFLQLPGIPPVPGSALHHGKPVKMILTANRLKGWSDEKFIDEYTKVHANMTEQISNIVPFMRSYTQVVGVPKLPIETFCTNQDDYEVATVLAWSSLDKLRGSFHHPSYKASAGKHVFAEPELTGSLSQTFEDVIFDPILFKGRQDCIEVMVLLTKISTVQSVPQADLQSRAESIKQISRGTGLLRYVLNRDVTPEDPNCIFKDTLFENGDWSSVGATEQYWFTDEQTAADFFAHPGRSQVLRKLPGLFDESQTISIVGRENRVFSKDLDF